MEFYSFYRECRLCPRECKVDRTKGEPGFCKEGHRLRFAYLGPHFGEEPPITGACGSGTLFFTGCTLRCSFCQNFQISRDGVGREIETEALLEEVCEMIRAKSVHNLNLVTPDHFFPHAFELVRLLRSAGYSLPVVYNLSGYQSLPLLRLAEDFADIYLPDFKYSDRSLAARLSACGDYPDRALDAIAEMVRQKGFLDSPGEGCSPANKGVLVRHLILPGQVENSLDALTTLYLEFGSFLPISLMSQYTPVRPHKMEALNRSLLVEEFHRVYEHAGELGFHHLFVQFPEEYDAESSGAGAFLPDFGREEPFSGKAPAPCPRAEPGQRSECFTPEDIRPNSAKADEKSFSSQAFCTPEEHPDRFRTNAQRESTSLRSVIARED